MATSTWGNVVNSIAGAAPLLGSLFGPAGTAVGAVASAGLKLVATALGCEPTQDAITAAIAADPNAALKLKEFEMNHKLELEKLAIQEFGMEVADKDSARKRQGEHEKTTGKSDLFLYMLAGWCILAPIGIILVLMFRGFPNMETSVALLVGGFLGIIVGEYRTVTGYFFGTNRNSQMKTDMIYNSKPIEK